MTASRIALLFLIAPALAAAEPRSSGGGGTHGHPMGTAGGFCGTDVRAPSASAGAARRVPATAISNVLFVDRCAGGCTFTGSQDHDAVASRVAINGTLPGKTYTFDEFSNFAEERGSLADAEWNDLVACVRKVYSYYNVQVVDTKPASGTYHRAVVTGFGSQLDQGSPEVGTLLGISDVQCRFIDNMSSFTFSDAHRSFARDGADFVRQLCVTVTHEAGHSFGLEHEFVFADGTSACNDPMSYDTGACDPPFRFFRNKPARCGGFEQTLCSCSGQSQVSHLILSSVFGPGTPTIATPTIEVTTPRAGAEVGAILAASGGHERGIDRVDFYINGYKWGQAPGAPFVDGAGQPDPSSYQLTLPKEVPGGVMDIQVKAYDDLGNEVASEVVTAMKGAPCVAADTCAKGQRCEAGKCFWDPPTGALGDSCTFSQACLSNICAGPSGDQICTTTCLPGIADSCESGFECVGEGNNGVCQLPDGGGCCSTGSGDGVPAAPVLLGATVFGALALRRRRRS
jgi:MYXO-CTERM domain-containing protein